MSEVLVDVQAVSYRYRLSGRRSFPALEDVSFQLRRGEIFGLVGESGAGKSTMAKCLMSILRPTSGRIFYDGIDLCDRADCRSKRRRLQSCRQLVFQDSASSLNPRMTVEEIITEPMRLQHRRPRGGSWKEEAVYQMRRVGLNEEWLRRSPGEMSGGQRQRAAIARALSMEPELLVADEPIASLDVSIQAQIVNLFRELKREQDFTMLLVAHDLALVEFLCDRVGVLYHGQLVETAPTRELFACPRHPYTRKLLASVPIPDPRRERERRELAAGCGKDRSGAEAGLSGKGGEGR